MKRLLLALALAVSFTAQAAFKLADRVSETSTTTGTGDVILAGALSSSYQAFSAVLSNGDTTWYFIVNRSAAEWESGLATYNSGANSITRTTVYQSTNANAAVNFSAGTKDVFISNPSTAPWPVVYGGTGAAPGGDDQVPVSDSATGATWRTIANCTDTAGNHLNYTQSTNTFSCGTSVPSATKSTVGDATTGSAAFDGTAGTTLTSTNAGMTITTATGGTPGGPVTLNGGSPSAASTGGLINITSGTGGVSSGSSGTVTLASGGTTNGAPGSVTISTPTPGNTANGGGNINITSNDAGATGLAGIITLQGGKSGTAQSGNSGGIVLQAGATAAVASIAGGPIAITAGAGSATTTGGTGGAVTITAGQGGLAVAGGQLNLVAGKGGATGTGGQVFITSGAGGATSGNSGAVTIASGATTNGQPGLVTISTPTPGTSGSAGGNINITSNDASATGRAGIITLQGGKSGTAQSGNSGGIVLQAGATAAVASIAGGPITITAGAGSATTTGGTGGAVTITAGQGGLAVAGGAASLVAGQGGATGAGGVATLKSGAGGATSGSSGNTVVATGTVTAGSTAGIVQLSPNNSAAVQVDANGHVNFSQGGQQTGAPTVTANCGTSPTITGNDSAFVLNVGTGGTATTCTVTFNKSFTNAPHCFVNDRTTAGTSVTRAAPATGTVVVSTGAAWAASTLIDVLCVGHL